MVAFTPYPFEFVQHSASLPPLADGLDRQRHSIAIVGGGPVGLALAVNLASHGVRSVVIEADDQVCPGSRAVCVSRRSLQILERMGAVEPFLATGLPWTGGRSYFRESEVLHFRMPDDPSQKLPPMVNVQQYYIEQFLLDRIAALGDMVDVRWQTRMTTFEQDEGGVTLDLSSPAGDYRLRSDWVVGCDGAHSRTREALGLKLEGSSYEGRYVVVDIILKSERPTGRLAWFDPPSNPGATILMHKQPNDVWRIDYQIGDDEDAADAVRPENVMPRVRQHLAMIGETGDWAPISISMYKAHALSLRDYRHGRAMFAGDAAHLVPIFGVRGLNSGIDDADNLAWKLAYVASGLASDRLLDSYSEERAAATRENLSHGRKSTEFMAPPTFAFELMREAVLSLAGRHPVLRSLISPRQTMPISYRGSPLNADSPEDFAAGPEPGDVMLDAAIMIAALGGARAGHLTDRIGPHFTALYFADRGPLPAMLIAEIAEIKSKMIPFELVTVRSAAPAAATAADGDVLDVDGALARRYDAKPETLYLLRPDGHVVERRRDGSGKGLAAAIDAVLAGGWKAP